MSPTAAMSLNLSSLRCEATLTESPDIFRWANPRSSAAARGGAAGPPTLIYNWSINQQAVLLDDNVVHGVPTRMETTPFDTARQGPLLSGQWGDRHALDRACL
ncbi:hypothetical protein Ssi03_37780 [Sphaerisporangium siamense]|nr:hypothetical protein Ssi03_37780 [Sphaerisporangium siamense]